MFLELLQQVSLESLFGDEELKSGCLGNHVHFGFPNENEIENYHLAFVGVLDDRGSVNNVGCAKSPDLIRKEYYRLMKSENPIPLFDAGNILPGDTLRDTYVALSNVVTELLRINIIPIIIGGSHDLTYAQFGGYQETGEMINVVVADSYIDLDDEESTNDRNWLIRLLTHQPNFLFNYSHIAYQTHFTPPQTLDTLDRMHFDVTRLGKVRGNTPEAEPVMRNANLVSFDMAAIKMSESPGNADATPNGLFADDLCQLARYAGQSNRVDSFGLYGANPLLDVRNQTIQLAAQIIWYFTDGYVARVNDVPTEDSEDYIKYHVHFRDNNYDMLFWKSLKTDNWWIEVPSSSINVRRQKKLLLPCSYADYLAACKEEMPERWLKTYHKLA